MKTTEKKQLLITSPALSIGSYFPFAYVVGRLKSVDEPVVASAYFCDWNLCEFVKAGDKPLQPYGDTDHSEMFY